MLVVDVGNTFTKIGAFAGDELVERRVLSTPFLELAELRDALGEAAGLAGEPEAWVASVYPDANAVIDSAAARAGLKRRFIRPGIDPIIPHRLATPETTGVDRLLSALAAGVRCFDWVDAREGYVVVQCGSAATVDLVDGDGVFRGGYILPGPAMWLRGLAGGAQLPDFSDETPDWESIGIGDNTRDAMLGGMHIALPVAVASAAFLINDRAGISAPAEGLPVAVTGGWGEAAARYMRSRTVYDKDLLLHGIRIFAERNR